MFSNTSRCVSDCDKELPLSIVIVCPSMPLEISELHRSIRLSYTLYASPRLVSLISISVPSGNNPHDAAPISASMVSIRAMSFVSCDMVLPIRIGMPNTSPNVSQ